MKLVANLRSLAFTLGHRSQIETEMDEELRSHIAHRADDLERSGMPRTEAERRAHIELGSHEKVKEECREALGTYLLDTLLQDIRFALRQLRKSPGFAAIAILTLALGIGANTAIFSVVQAVLLAPLPYPEPDRVLTVSEKNPRFPLVAVSYPNFRDRQRDARSFEQMAAFAPNGYDLTSPGIAEHLDGEITSSGFFAALGVKPALGRDFSPIEDVHGGAPVAIISDRLWRDRFAASPEALGKSLTLNGLDYTIVGVLPSGFRFLVDSDLFTPLGQADSSELNMRGSHWLSSIARLKSGISISQAQAEMDAIQNALDRLYPDANRDLGINLMPVKELAVGNVRETLLLLLGAVGLVLLIACANVASLLLARAAVRSREFAIRLAIGANRWRVVRQLLTESVLLSLAGGAVGLAVAKWALNAVLAVVPRDLPFSENIGLNIRVLSFTSAVAVAVAILFGLAPALKSSKPDLQTSLKESGDSSTDTHHRAQSCLVILQMAMTLVLLAGASLLFRTIRHLWNVDPGFDPQHLISFKVGVSPSLTKTPASTRIAYQQMIERIRQIPGVQAADFTDVVPLSPQGGTMPFWIGSRKPASLQAAPRLMGFLAGPDYLRTMGIPLLRGRFFTLQDNSKTPCVVIIDSVLARIYFPTSDPLGQTITFAFSETGPCRIVGVVGHVKHQGLEDSAANIQSQMYFPLYQDPDQWVAANYPNENVIVRTPLDTAALMPALKAAVYASSGDQPVYDVQTVQQIVSNSMSSKRFPMILLGTFGGLAMLIASVGIYGVISYSTAQRVRELGIRMALGADRSHVFRMVIGQGLRLTLIGVAVGATAALILSRLVSSFSHLLYGVGAGDPVTFIAVSLVLIGASILACYVPARRATRVDPMVALRYE